MVTVRRVLVVSLVLALAGACLAQGPPPGGQGGQGGGGRGGPGGRGGMGGGGLMQSVLEDIFTLNQLVALQLTDQQLDGILEAYTKFPLTTDERIAKLMEMRGRLVAGTALTPADGETIRGMFQRQTANQPEPANPLAEAIWKQLTPAQQGSLLASGRFGAGGPGGGQWNRDRTLDLLTHLNQAMEAYQEADWPAKQDALAEAMASTVAEAQRANAKAMYTDFLERMWQMPGADFEAKKNELATTLESLVPQGSSLAPALALISPQAVTRAMDGTFLSAKSVALLKEIKAARTAMPGQ